MIEQPGPLFRAEAVPCGETLAVARIPRAATVELLVNQQDAGMALLGGQRIEWSLWIGSERSVAIDERMGSSVR